MPWPTRVSKKKSDLFSSREFQRTLSIFPTYVNLYSADTSSSTYSSPTTARVLTFTLGISTITQTYLPITDPCVISQQQWSSSSLAFFGSAVDAGNDHLRTMTSTHGPITNFEPVYSVTPYYSADDFTAYYAYYTTNIADIRPSITETIVTTEYPSYTVAFPSCQTIPPSDCGPCAFAANSLKLIAFAATTAPGNPSSTLTPNATGLVTGYYDGTAYPSGSVYLKYANASAVNSCGTVGSVYSGAVLTLASSEASSLIGDGTYPVFGRTVQLRKPRVSRTLDGLRRTAKMPACAVCVRDADPRRLQPVCLHSAADPRARSRVGELHDRCVGGHLGSAVCLDARGGSADLCRALVDVESRGGRDADDRSSSDHFIIRGSCSHHC